MPGEVAQPYLPIPGAISVPIHAEHIRSYIDEVEARRRTTRQQRGLDLEHDASAWTARDYFDENAWRGEDGTGEPPDFDWTDVSATVNVSSGNSSGGVAAGTTFSSGGCYATYAGSTIGTAQGSDWYEGWWQGV